MTATDVIVIVVIAFTLGIGLLIMGTANSYIMDNMANATNSTSTYAANAFHDAGELTQKYDYIFTSIFIGLVLALIITSYFIGANPVFFIVYLLVIVILVVVSAILANTWEVVSTNPTFTPMLTHLPITNHILNYLPFYTAAVGFIGVVVAFAKPFSEQQGGALE